MEKSIGLILCCWLYITYPHCVKTNTSPALVTVTCLGVKSLLSSSPDDSLLQSFIFTFSATVLSNAIKSVLLAASGK